MASTTVTVDVCPTSWAITRKHVERRVLEFWCRVTRKFGAQSLRVPNAFVNTSE